MVVGTRFISAFFEMRVIKFTLNENGKIYNLSVKRTDLDNIAPFMHPYFSRSSKDLKNINENTDNIGY